MEDAILKLNDIISKKETETYSITGTANEEGSFRCVIDPEAKFTEGITHYVYLKSFTGWSYFLNIDRSNNKFFYWQHTKVKGELTWYQTVLKFETGAYQITDYNNMIHTSMMSKNHKGEPLLTSRSEDEIKADPKDEFAITIFPYIPTSRIMIRIKKGYSVGFQEGTWLKELGFNKDTFLKEGLHTAPNRADLMKTLKIRIVCNLCNGFKINGKKSDNDRTSLVSSNVLYEFPNNTATGESISINPNPVIYTTLLQKRFSEIKLTFVDDDNKPVNFQGEEFNCVLVITQG